MTQVSEVKTLTPQLLHILQHSLGVDEYGQGPQYRNHFVTEPKGKDGQWCLELVEMGYMKDHGAQRIAGNMHCYTVTPEGVDAVALQSPVRPPKPKLTRSQQNYQRYLDCETSDSFAEFMGFHKKRKTHFRY
jgi:hypothetical protein